MSQSGRILIVDDEANARSALAELLREEGYSVETAADGFKALPKLDEFAPDVVVTDLKMPGLDGLGLMHKALAQDADRAVIIMTAYGAIETAVAAMRAGAADYLSKPINFDELMLVVERALERRRLRQEAGLLRQRLTQRHRIPSIIGGSPVMQAVFDTVLQVAPSRASVLITGESGTGKELVAAALHEHSSRASGPFIKLHCAALTETLLESELFGHERGAFTGALTRRDGRFQQADRGTLFLDEIGEISPSVQIKLLRFLQEHEFERVGGNQTIKVDVRIVAATNRNLRERIQQGLFREDLYYRLNVISIEMPSLRQRVSDIALLAQHFLAKYAHENRKTVTAFSDEAMDKLMRYSWPGNVRELENAIERAVITCRGETLRPEDIAVTLAPADTKKLASDYPAVPGTSLSDLERFAILKTLEHTGGSTSRAAEILGISPRKIQYKLQAYQADPSGPMPAKGSPKT
jgi:DNA-binding NtrC family response regulator